MISSKGCHSPPNKVQTKLFPLLAVCGFRRTHWHLVDPGGMTIAVSHRLSVSFNYKEAALFTGVVAWKPRLAQGVSEM